jgi:hypothetical protein
MTFIEPYHETVPVQLPNGSLIKVEVAATGREDVGFDVKNFQDITDAIEGIAEMISYLKLFSHANVISKLALPLPLTIAATKLPCSI